MKSNALLWLTLIAVAIVLGCQKKERKSLVNPSDSVEDSIEAPEPDTLDAEPEGDSIVFNHSCVGDFDGDGSKDTATLIEPRVDWEANDFVGGDSGIVIKFSDKDVPTLSYQSVNANLQCLGDLNDDGRDEIGFWPMWFTSCWVKYHVWTLKDGEWEELIEPFESHYSMLEKKGVDFIPVEKARKGYVNVYYSDSNPDYGFKVTKKRVKIEENGWKEK